MVDGNPGGGNPEDVDREADSRVGERQEGDVPDGFLLQVVVGLEAAGQAALLQATA